MSQITKACPKCGADLEISQALDKLVCTRPSCRFRCPVPEDLKLRALGAPELPLYSEVRA